MSKRIRIALSGALLAVMLLALFVYLPMNGADSYAENEAWRSYSSLETIVLENEYENRTEEEIGVLPVGQYKISIPNLGYLTYGEEGSALSVSKNDQNDVYTVIYQVTGDMPRYTLSPGDALYSVIGTASGYSITTQSGVVFNNSRTIYTSLNSSNGYYRATQDSYRSIRWYFEENEDGTCKLALYDMDDPKASNAWRYYAYYDASDGKIKMKRDTQNLSTDFKIEMVSRGTAQFDQHISYGGKITLRLPKAAKTQAHLSDERAAKWANDLEKAYWYFNDLTNFIPYENIIVKAYANCDYMAYVTSGYNTITVSYSASENAFGPQKLWYIEDISELVARGEEANDWNFCVLHEMGHMFDMNRGWRFETECETDFKLAYCLYRGGASATPSELSAKDVFTYDNIEVCYKKMGGDFSKTYEYTFYGAAYKLMLMQKAIGWEPVYRAFHWYSENEALPASERTAIPNTNYGKFQLFIDKISEYAGVDVQNTFFSEVDWAVFMNYYKNPDYPELPAPPEPEDGAKTFRVAPLYGHIENYSGKTYFIAGVTSENNTEIFTKLKSGEFTLKAIVTDETDGAKYTVNPYHFDAPGAEFYESSFLRLNFCDYGVVPVPGHEYTLVLDVYEGQTRKYTGQSAEGAFLSSNADFIDNGAILPATVKYGCEVECASHLEGEPQWTWTRSTAVMTVTCTRCGNEERYQALITLEDGAMIATVRAGDRIYTDQKAFKRGDVTLNGTVNIQDVTVMLNYLSKSGDDASAYLADNDYLEATFDVNGDGAINIADVTALLDIAAGK